MRGFTSSSPRTTYRRSRAQKRLTVATETPQRIVDEVVERARGNSLFSVEVSPRFWIDHQPFADAVITEIAGRRVFRLFDGLTANEHATLGSETRSEPTAIPETSATEQVATSRRDAQSGDRLGDQAPLRDDSVLIWRSVCQVSSVECPPRCCRSGVGEKCCSGGRRRAKFSTSVSLICGGWLPQVPGCVAG